MEDEKVERLINDLRNLRKKEAPDNFEFRLKAKLQNSASEEPALIKKDKKLIPAFVLASVVLLLFIIYRPFTDEYEDPFQIQPQIREDIIAYSENEDKAHLSELINDSFRESDSNFQGNIAGPKYKIPQNSQDLNDRNYSSNQYQFSISKEDLNFTRPVMNEEEKKQVQLLKQKLMSKNTNQAH